MIAKGLYSEEELRNIVAASEEFRKVLTLLLKDMPTPKLTEYDSAGWPYKEADRLGYNRAVSDLHKYITIEGDNP